MTGLADDAEVEGAVLRYLAEHPNAADTLRGIACWWLAQERVRWETTRVAGILERLVNRGVLDRLGSGEAALYRLRTK